MDFRTFNRITAILEKGEEYGFTSLMPAVRTSLGTGKKVKPVEQKNPVSSCF